MSAVRIVVLASGSGTLFQALIDNQDHLNIEIVALVVDKDVPAIERAHKHGISVIEVPINSDRGEWDLVMHQVLTDLHPEFVVSAGFMRILGPNTVRGFLGRLINTHPALLPNFPGAHAVRDALAAGVQETGCTVHFVDEGVDTGPVISQRVVQIDANDTESSLHERIKIQERELLVETLHKLVDGTIRYHDGKVVTA